MIKQALVIILFLFFIKPASAITFKSDSTGTITDTLGFIYILHQVEAGETFYSIARKYHAEPKKVIELNPRNTLFLDIGETIKVPTGKRLKVPAGKRSNASKTNSAGATKYKVQKSENLYQISKKFKVSVKDLKKWNNLSGNNLSLGQELIVKNPNKWPEIRETEDDAPVPPNSKNNKIEAVNENGIAGWIDSKYLDPKKSLALHKTAPVGTIIRITNKMNNKSVFVKVIGTLPEMDDNQNLIILISKTAKDYLGVIDPRFQCTLEYSLSH